MRDNARSPLIPLPFEQSARGVKRELIIDYDKGEIYVVSPDDETILINITGRIREAVTNYINSIQGDQITDISNTYVTIENVGRINIAELLKFLLEHGVDAFPCNDLGPIALRRLLYDNASIITTNDKVSVAGFNEAGTNYIPVKKEGTIQWIPISNIPTPEGYTPNKYDISNTDPIDGIITLTDNPIQKSLNIEGPNKLKLPTELDTKYCIIRWIVSTVETDGTMLSFDENITWRYSTDPDTERGNTYIYQFETFDGGNTWYGQKVSFDNIPDGSSTVTVEQLYNDFFTKKETLKLVSWETLDSESVTIQDDSTNESNENTDVLNFNQVVEFKFCLSKTYKSLSVIHTNYLYFLVDTGEIYKGGISFTDALVKCRKFPADPITGKLYYNTTTKELKYYDIASAEWISLLTPMVESLFEEGVDYGAVTVTGKAIKEYIDTKFNELYESLGKQPGYNTVPIFDNYDIAVTYAKSNPLAKAGQCVTAPSQSGDGELVMYVIQPDKTLKEYPSMEQIKQLISWKSE